MLQFGQFFIGPSGCLKRGPGGVERQIGDGDPDHLIDQSQVVFMQTAQTNQGAQ